MRLTLLFLLLLVVVAETAVLSKAKALTKKTVKAVSGGVKSGVNKMKSLGKKKNKKPAKNEELDDSE
ncbi:hypothetical protein GCK32_021286 [Trichostrongylus colubriformis]|uniref:Uncharacterized protein n=1 Tax=Trichostrongylus colubriformis TaxID=6319 RepID=A0AAN8ISB3_TRICO